MFASVDRSAAADARHVPTRGSARRSRPWSRARHREDCAIPAGNRSRSSCTRDKRGRTGNCGMSPMQQTGRDPQEIALLHRAARYGDVHLDEIRQAGGAGRCPRRKRSRRRRRPSRTTSSRGLLRIHRADAAEAGTGAAGHHQLRRVPGCAAQRPFLPRIGHRAFHEGDRERPLRVVAEEPAKEIHDVHGTDHVQQLVLAVENHDLLAPAAAQSKNADSWASPRSLLYDFRKIDCIPVREDRTVNARVLVADAAMAALAHAALHPALEAHQDAVLVEVELEQLGKHELVDDGGPTTAA